MLVILKHLLHWDRFKKIQLWEASLSKEAGYESESSNKIRTRNKSSDFSIHERQSDDESSAFAWLAFCFYCAAMG